MRCCDFGTSRLRAAAGAEWLGTPRGNCDHPGQWSMGSTNGGFLRIELHLFYFSPPARWGSLDFISQRIDMTVEVICHFIWGFPQLQHWPWVAGCFHVLLALTPKVLLYRWHPTYYLLVCWFYHRFGWRYIHSSLAIQGATIQFLEASNS